MVMDWMEGESLSARIQRVGPMSLDEVRRLLVPCMRGMHAAHAAGLVHRDLNPTNILVCQPDGHSPEIAKVLDFSVVHFPSAEAAAVAAMSKSFGSPDFLSPEQRFGLPADHRADVYAFGAILYQALSGRPPIAATTFDQRLVFNTPLLPAGVGELRAAGTLLTRALAPELSERFQTLALLADALEACGRAPRRVIAAQENTPPPVEVAVPRAARESFVPRAAVEPASAPGRGPRSARSAKWFYAAAGVTALATVGAWLYEERSSSDTEVIASFEAVASVSPVAAPPKPSATPEYPAIEVHVPPPSAAPAPASTPAQPSAPARVGSAPEVVRLPLKQSPAPDANTRRPKQRANPWHEFANVPLAPPATAQPSSSDDRMSMDLF